MKIPHQTTIDKTMKDLDNCGDKYCGNMITAAELKKEGDEFLHKVLKKCRSKTTPKNEKEYKLQRQKYDKCFTKYKTRSKYNKRLTQRKKCEDKYCSKYQKKIQSLLS